MGLRKTECSEGRLDPSGAIAQKTKIPHRASSVADLQIDTIAGKYSSILFGKLVVPGACYPGRNCKAMWRYRIYEAISDV